MVTDHMEGKKMRTPFDPEIFALLALRQTMEQIKPGARKQES